MGKNIEERIEKLEKVSDLKKEKQTEREKMPETYLKYPKAAGKRRKTSKKPHKYTKLLQFDRTTQEKIIERDRGCIFCLMGYPRENATWFELGIKDIMHFIPKSQMGMGIERNGALGCRYHHNLLDNGNKGLREEMLSRFEEYLRNIYPDWNKEDLIYSKYDFKGG